MKQVIVTSEAPLAIGPYSQAIRQNNLLFVSGQIPIDPKTGEIKQGIKEQTEQVLKNLKAILNASNMDLENIVKTTVYLTDLTDFPTVNDTYGRWFAKDPPARSTVQVSRLPKDVKIEIEAIAIV